MLICSNYQEDRHVKTEGPGGNLTLNLYDHQCPSTPQESPPSYSRLPPDGHEFPSNYSEGLQDKISRYTRSSHLQEGNSEVGSSTLPRSPPKGSLSPYESRSLFRWRRQDERSERSVKDKIAMFSTDSPRTKSRKIDRSDSTNNASCEESDQRKSLTDEDIRSDLIVHEALCKRDSLPEKPSASRPLSQQRGGSLVNVNCSDLDMKENFRPASSDSEEKINNLVIKSGKQPADQALTKDTTVQSKTEGISGLNNRSQSLIDIGKPSRMKRHSVGAYDRPFAYKYGVEKPDEKERRTSLNNLIEQRRKSMSKLRGLVIPETRLGDIGQRVPLDLPKISSHTATQAVKTMSLTKEDNKSSRLYKTDSISSIDSCSSSNSRNSSIANTYTAKSAKKHGPASLKKSSGGSSKVGVTSPVISRPTRNQSPSSDISRSSPTPRIISPQRGFEKETTPLHDSGFEMEQRYSSEKSSLSTLSSSHKSSLDSRMSGIDDSDNDSAVSSTQSSFSQSLSPRASPMPDNSDQEDNHSPTRLSRPRHSSQSSFDELDSKRILKNGTIEAENRRNILKSAKCSSGRSSDEHSTPESTRKFSSESSKGLPSSAPPLSSEPKKVSIKRNLRREPSNDSTCSSSRPSSRESYSRRASRDSVVNVSCKKEQHDLPAETVYFDNEGEMFKEAQIKVAYLNEIVDDFEEINEKAENTVIAEIKLPNQNIDDNKKVKVPTLEKWISLEHKYHSNIQKDFSKKLPNKVSKYTPPGRNSTRTTGRSRSGVASQKTDFKSVASKWKQRAEEDHNPPQPQTQIARRDSFSKLTRTTKKEDQTTYSSAFKFSATNKSVTVTDSLSKTESTSQSAHQLFDSRGVRPTNLELPRSDLPDRKFSVPEYGSTVKMRDKKDGSIGDVLSRPTSLIEGTDAMNPLQHEGHYMAPLSPSSMSTDSRDDFVDSSESSLSRSGSKEVLNAFLKPQINSVIPKMSEIMRAFEKHDLGRKGISTLGSSHPRMSSLDSTASDDGSQGAHYGSVSSLASGQRDQYGSITSLSSSTSIISPQELAQLIEEANLSLEESGTPSHEILVVVLHREVVGHGSIGITLAGGADYETKEITVHKIIPGSLADRDGRIQKGDRVLSINGKTLRGVGHREALNILKSPRPEVVLVLSRSRSVTPQESTVTHSNGDAELVFSHRPVFINHVGPTRPPKILESPMDSKSLVSDAPIDTVPRGPPTTIALVKDGAGLGFSLEGGKDSPLGDRPLTIKKVFSGGAADKAGVLRVGDELRSVNNVDLSNMARIEAWNFLKKLPDGTVMLVIRKKLDEDADGGPKTVPVPS